MFSMKKYYLPILSVAALSLFTACDDDIDHGGFGGKNGRNTLSFGVGVCTPTTPRLSTRAIPLTSSEDGEEPLFLIESVTPMEELFFDTQGTPATQSATRGTPVYSENFDAVNDDMFYAVCYSSDCGKTGSGGNEAYTTDTYYGTGKHTFEKDETGHPKHGGLTPTESCYAHEYADEMHWPEDKTLHFFFEAPSRGDLGNDGVTRFVNGNIQFNYAMTDEEKDAVNQQDLLFGYMALSMGDYDEDNHTTIPFHHALCAVKFNSGYGTDNAAKITKVEIKNLYSAGTCTIPSSGTVTWNYPTETIPTINVYSDYSDVTPTTYTKNGADGTEQASGFPDEFFTTENGKSTTTNSLNDANFTHTFHLIPQTSNSTGDEDPRVSFVIHYTINGESKTRTVTPSISWTAGNIYTYTLTINDAAVTVSESGGALLTTNSGNVTEYQRVALAANWVTTDGTIVASQPLSSDWLTGLPTGSTGSGARWALGTDGYYYYSHPVQPGNAAAVSLYTARTTPEAPANLPVADAHLEVNVTVQAVRANNKDGSGNDVYGYTVWTSTSGLSDDFFESPAQEGN